MSKTLSELAKGPWNNSTAYIVGDIVDLNGSSYLCISNHTNYQPPNATYWQVIASKGDTGPTGPTGPIGAKGDKGDPGTGEIPGGVENNIVTIDTDEQIVDSGKPLPTGNVVGTTDTQTITNKRITKRVQSVTDAATITPSWDNDDDCNITAIAQAFTLANPSGTPTSNQAIVIRIKDNGTGRAITYGNQYRAIGVTLPTTTTANKTTYLGGKWNATDSKVDVLAVGQEA